MGCQLHVPGAENLFDQGSFGLRNFELGTPNSVHGYTLTRPTWRRMRKRAGVHYAGAVHVQIFCTCFCFAAPTGQTVGTADAKLAGHMHATTTYLFLWLPFLYDAGCARQDRKVYLRGVLRGPVLGNFELSTPNLVH